MQGLYWSRIEFSSYLCGWIWAKNVSFLCLSFPVAKMSGTNESRVHLIYSQIQKKWKKNTSVQRSFWSLTYSGLMFWLSNARCAPKSPCKCPSRALPDFTLPNCLPWGNLQECNVSKIAAALLEEVGVENGFTIYFREDKHRHTMHKNDCTENLCQMKKVFVFSSFKYICWKEKQ